MFPGGTVSIEPTNTNCAKPYTESPNNVYSTFQEVSGNNSAVFNGSWTGEVHILQLATKSGGVEAKLDKFNPNAKEWGLSLVVDSCEYPSIAPSFLPSAAPSSSPETGIRVRLSPRVHSGQGQGKCLGYDGYGDLGLVDCTNGLEQKFRLEEDGKLVAEGGSFATQCVKADGWFWPKLRTCTKNDDQMKWDFSFGKITTANGTKCLRLDPNWSTSRLKVENCDNDEYDNIWLLNNSPITTMSGMCVGYDGYGDLGLNTCTSGAEQQFQMDSKKQLVALGGTYAGKCLLADGGFWPKLRPCDDTNMNQKWEYKGGRFATAEGTKCLHYDPNWSTLRLKVEDCNNETYDRIWLWNAAPIEGRGKCIGYDGYGDLGLNTCTGGAEQKFALDSDGRIVSQGGDKAFQCVFADGSFWPKLRPCEEGNLLQLWKYDGKKIMMSGANKCLRRDPSWSKSRLKVEDCDNDNFDAIWF